MFDYILQQTKFLYISISYITILIKHHLDDNYICAMSIPITELAVVYTMDWRIKVKRYPFYNHQWYCVICLNIVESDKERTLP